MKPGWRLKKAVSSAPGVAQGLGVARRAGRVDLSDETLAQPGDKPSRRLAAEEDVKAGS
jgi:hypothetical protein